MIVRVTKDNVIVDEIPTIHKGEFGVHECEFRFTPEYNNLIKTAIFENGDYQIGVSILDNKCSIPNEVLKTRYNEFKLRVYSYEIINNNLVIRYSPTYTTIPIVEGSYIDNTTNSKEVTPSIFDQYISELNKGLLLLAESVKDLKQKEESGYFDGAPGPRGPAGPQGPVGPEGETGPAGQDGTDGFSPIATVTKSGDTATISITDALGTTTATVSDGVSPTMSDSYGTSTTNGYSQNFINNINSYSSNEIRVGTWLGKPIYRKVIEINSSQITSQSNSIAHNISNLEVITNQRLIWKRNTNQLRQFPSVYYSNTAWDGQMIIDNSNIIFELGSTLLDNMQNNLGYCYVILEYTKTTD